MTLFIDSSVIMYAGGDEHPLRAPCVRIMDEVRQRMVDATTSAEVVQEILHRFVAVRRHELGVAMARSTLEMFTPVLPITHRVMDRMPDLVERYPALAARDLVHVATCLEEGIGEIVSTDRGFDTVVEVSRIDPAAYAA
jgi:hypothetical protein